MSLSPKSGSLLIAVTLTPPLRLSAKLSNSPILTWFLNIMLPVLLNATIKSPILKSPSSLVPEV